ncbi:DNA mismatch repair protein MutT [Actinoplanes cyaneus]|uniref:DNA mismatch repair protein MutT n=1 Tax=Actinoplanes cyaneus TaxID=52696 RepID=A0A919IKL0_9ACTN|nr:NUDIX domain-containing protein [Actinoplanes cyaneus]MCW2140467.1 8-oxo-dGTP pyrophosphatase MutT, NUDIX family [Actinoplanes cyaneus]GID67574.1 DNA mismatch repair protein MutT [Actinoplanes cyaneus]
MTESNQPTIERRAGRVLLVDRAGRALLLHGGDPARPGTRWWFTPGGGLEPGESTVQAAARELFEETGLRVDAADLGEPILHELTEFSFNGRDYAQTQDFFLFRVTDWQVDTAGMDEEEQLTIIEHRWWSASELEGTDELIYPVGLAGLLRSQVDGASPAAGTPASLAAGSQASSAAGAPAAAPTQVEASSLPGAADRVREKGL